MKHATLETPTIRGHRQFGTSGGVFHLWHLDEPIQPADKRAPEPVAVGPAPVTEAVATKATQTSFF